MGTGNGKTADEERKAGEEARETEAEGEGPGRRAGAEPGGGRWGCSPARAARGRPGGGRAGFILP